MSTKDLIERLNRTTTTRRAAPAGDDATEGDGTKSSKTSIRVGTRVIRRRRDKAAPPALPVAAAPAEKPIPPAKAAPKVEVKTEAAPAPEKPAATEPAPKTAETPVVAKAAETKEESAKNKATAAKPTTAGKAPSKITKTVEPKAAKVDEKPESKTATSKAKATPVKQSDTVSTKAAKAAPEPAKAETAAAAEPAKAEAAAAAEPAKAKAETAAEPEKTETDPTKESPVAAAAAEARPKAPGLTRLNLPRLSGAGGKSAFPGLGSAVVRPPPGYDPANPSASVPAAKKEPTEDRKTQWRDETGPGGAKRTGAEKTDRQNPRSRPKRQQKRRGRVEMYMDEFQSPRRRRGRNRSAGPKKASPQAKALKRRVEVDGTITVTNLAHAMSVKAADVIKNLIDMGTMATANDEIDLDTAQLIAAEFEHEIINRTFQEDDHLIQVEDTDENSVPRSPVVTIMGHVDHGKTTLLDTIRNANVVDGEAGGITQHTAAYQVTHKGRIITFIDTPGHEAFTEMRSRGANITDIVVLVVAADDGIMPQTIEAISHSKAAGVQIIVAVNKCDKPGVKPEVVRQALMGHDLVAEEFGGDIVMCNVSALKNEGIENLLENIQLLSELGEYSSNPERHAEGTVLEARLQKGLGPVATVLVQHGTLQRGQSVVLGTVWGRVRAMHDYKGNKLKEAGPSTPVEIHGLQDVPKAGDNLVVVSNDKAARTLAAHRAETLRESRKEGPAKVTLEDLLKKAEEGEKVKLNLIVRSDVGGTLEALRASLDKIDVPGTEVKILHAAVGAITESDITLAHTYGGIVLGFNVRPDSKGRRAADSLGVEIRTYSVIYEALEEVELALRGLLAPTIRELVKGSAKIRETFSIPKIGTIAGCMVIDGTVARPHIVRLLRDGVILWEGRLGSLRRFKDDVKEVNQGYECGMNLEGYNDIKVGDVIETFVREEVSALS